MYVQHPSFPEKLRPVKQLLAVYFWNYWRWYYWKDNLDMEMKAEKLIKLVILGDTSTLYSMNLMTHL